MAIKIRLVCRPEKLVKKHIETLEQLDEHFFPGVPYPIKGSYWWIAFDDDKPIGYAGLDPTRFKNKCFLCRAGVVAQYRGTGIHKRLIKARERMARKIGIKRVVTYTSHDNIPSCNSLIKRGYIRYRPGAEYGVDNAIYFSKEL
jgi:GNAT superfamily N-acetyltransferase